MGILLFEFCKFIWGLGVESGFNVVKFIWVFGGVWGGKFGFKNFGKLVWKFYVEWIWLLFVNKRNKIYCICFE